MSPSPSPCPLPPREREHRKVVSLPILSVEQARRLLKSIDTGQVVGLRDRAIIGILVYTAARVGAATGNAEYRRTDLDLRGRFWGSGVLNHVGAYLRDAR